MTDRDLAGKVAIVTGGAGGIGSATARALADAGASVVVADLATAPYDEVAKALVDTGGRAIGHPVDLTDEASIDTLVNDTVAELGGLDIVDNNAAATTLAPQDVDLMNLPVEIFDQTMATNVRGPMLLAKYALPVLIDRGGGVIVNISSGLSLTGETMNPSYSASKAALNSLTRHIATTYGGQGIRCNAIAPGLIETPTMLATMPPPALDIFREHCLIPRLGLPEDIAQMVVFLASDRSAYVTGQVLSVDGGFLAHAPNVPGIRKLIARMSAPTD